MSGQSYQLGRNYISSIRYDEPEVQRQAAYGCIAHALTDMARLNLQHFLWRESLGYLLHPDIPIPDKGLKVADVGTGTGLWLFDVAKHLPPSSELDGFDISDNQYPPRDCLPGNVSLGIVDAMDEPPAHLIGRYDVVHIRLFISLVTHNDPRPLLDHCCKLLKPGGYLQWEEFDIYSQQVISSQGSPTEYTTALSAFMNSNKNLGWVASLPEIFQEYGLEEVKVDKRRERREFRRMYMDLTILRVQERAAMYFDKHGLPGSGDAHRERARKALEEAEQGTSISEINQVALGRKPMAGARQESAE